ncbi:MAG: glycoside hydrolase family 38 C-terminal domain-containing protein [Cyclobacteriaceae bacterium]
MKDLFLRIFIILPLFHFLSSCTQKITELEDPWPVNGEGHYQGFAKVVSGTELDFFPFLDDGNISLYVGENGKYPFFEMETEIIPEDYDQEYITFIWNCALSKSTGSKQSEYRMSINGAELVVFNSHSNNAPSSWEHTSDNGTQVAFVNTLVAKANGDLFGYMILNLPVANYEKGKAVSLKFEEVQSNPTDYYMAIQNPAIESLDIMAEPAILKSEGGPKQSIKVDLTHMGDPTTAEFSLDQTLLTESDISAGLNEVYVLFEPVTETKVVTLDIEVAGKDKVSKEVELNPVREFEVYFLPHSHVDIGFTHKQQEVAELQWKNLDLAIDLAEKTKDYPERSRYKWNAEISWVLDGYLKQASAERKKKFIQAYEDGVIGIDALYGSVLTGIQKEEEMFKNTEFASQLAKEYGFDIQSAMITDVPGYTWGLVPGMAQMGMRYLSVGPNHMPQLANGGYQVGHTFRAWGDVPFYWKSPSGKEKILFWMSSHGYSWFHSWSIGNISWRGGTPILNFLTELEDQKYPYDIVQLRYNIGNDNGPPDEDMPDFFKEWNEKYEWPKFRIATTMEMMTDFEEKYADQIPEASGDFTPYWEDGVASSAEETAINRITADRLIQAETLWSMLNPDGFPKNIFDEAWKNIVLFSEHTWGANISKSDPDSEFTKSLWDVKKGFTLDAQAAANEMISSALAEVSSDRVVEAFQIINSLSWPRTGLIKLPAEWQKAGNTITDRDGNEINSQLLSSGGLAFVARDVPPFGSKMYVLKEGDSEAKGSVEATAISISNDQITIKLDEETGAIASLKKVGVSSDFVDASDTVGFNTYWYSGLIKSNLSQNHSPKFTVKENGPLLSTIEVVTSGAGANGITQEIELVDGLDRVGITNVVDKIRVVDDENVRFSFPFSVPNGDVRIDIPWAVLEPGKNQLNGANFNFFSVQRFIDISNESYGITLTTPDAPVWEIGDMNGQFWMKDMKNRPWLKEYEPSQRLFSWVMNNAWFVNYKAYQEGMIKFRYALRPHGQYSVAEAKRSGIEESTPMLAVATHKDSQPIASAFTLSGSDDVIVTSFKPSAEGNAWMIRFFNSSDSPSSIKVNWGSKKPTNVYLSSPLEEIGSEVNNSLDLVPWEIVTIRAEFK